MPYFLNMNDGSMESVYNTDDFYNILNERLGYEAAEYFKDNVIADEEYNDMLEENIDLSNRIDELETEIQDKEYEIELLENKIEELKEQLPRLDVDDILSMKICFIIKEMQKIPKSKNNEQKEKIIDMLKELANIK